MEEDKGSVGSAYEFAESQHRGEDSRHLLAEACSQQDSCCGALGSTLLGLLGDSFTAFSCLGYAHHISIPLY